MNKNYVNSVWHYDSRNCYEQTLSDYYNGLRFYLRPYKTGYKFYIAIRRNKKHDIGDSLTNGTPVAYFRNCSLEEAKIKGIEHFQWMLS